MKRRHVLLILMTCVVFGAVGIGGTVYWRRQQAQQFLEAAQVATARFQYEQAADLAEQATALRANHGEIRLEAARACRRAGRLDVARSHLDAARELLGETEDVRLELQLLAAQKGELTLLAEQALVSRAELDAKNRVLIYEALIAGYLESLRLAPALHLLEHWLATSPHDPRPYYWSGLAKEQFRGYRQDQAIADYRRAVELNPTYVEPREQLAYLLLKQKNIREAHQHFEELVRQQPDRSSALVGLGLSKLANGESEAGRSLFKRALELDPDNGVALRELGVLDLADGRLDTAEKQLRRAHELKPRDLTVCYNLMVCLQRQGRDAEARTFEEKQQSIAATEKRLLELLRGDLTQRPRDPDVLYQVAELYMSTGDRDDLLAALQFLQRAIDANPNHRPTLLKLAEYFERRGKPDVASRFRLQAGRN